ncbi:3'(2'),5'-bisphosphate nucleotidase CysQ [Buchnera aphidicola (Eriosoma lanigerum)]|uniref:3'(2'),5'-bisphosphate nucleotidase CysQ n=1 Tax=Buchnera aphidicola TaxID=9 RepID=UPI00346486CD
MLKKLVFLIRQAGDRIRYMYENEFSSKIFYKENQSPVTDADYVSHEIIITGLQELTPDIPVLSEENYADHTDYNDFDKYWLIDPLDGTKEFINHNNEFTVNMALIEYGIPVLGLIYAPMYNTLYYSWNNSAWKEQNNIIEKIRVIDHDPPNIVVSRSHDNRLLDQYLQNINFNQIIRLGSSLKFCLVAEGKVQLYPRFGKTSIWDIAAGHAIIIASGGYMQSIQIDKRINYILSSSNFSVINPSFYASSKLIK